MKTELKAFVNDHIDTTDECYDVIMGEIDSASNDELEALYDRIEEYILTSEW